MKHPTKNIERKVGIAGCKHTTRDLILALKREGFLIDHVITIDPEKGENQEVSGYMDLRPFLDELNISYTIADKYSLKSESDMERILAEKLDILFCMGWQRLIPDWLLNDLSIGAFGMHGSSRPLPYGRGRSPMNWSLIQGKNLFYTHLFQYLPGVDDGPIVAYQTFDINRYDTCLTTHFKNTIAMSRLCAQYLPALMDGTVDMTKQSEEGATYYPKRGAEDGLIDWELSTNKIFNLVRGVTRPFPGAFSYIGDTKLTVWQAVPFDTKLTYPDNAPGEIVEVFYNGQFVVKTGDYSLLVQDYKAENPGIVTIGAQFHNGGITPKQWKRVPLRYRPD